MLKLTNMKTDLNTFKEVYSLVNIIGGYTDFINKKTRLHHRDEDMGQRLKVGVIVDPSSKCHPDISREGIEYAWAQAKMYIRNIPWKS